MGKRRRRGSRTYDYTSMPYQMTLTDRFNSQSHEGNDQKER